MLPEPHLLYVLWGCSHVYTSSNWCWIPTFSGTLSIFAKYKLYIRPNKYIVMERPWEWFATFFFIWVISHFSGSSTWSTVTFLLCLLSPFLSQLWTSLSVWSHYSVHLQITPQINKSQITKLFSLFLIPSVFYSFVDSTHVSFIYHILGAHDK